MALFMLTAGLFFDWSLSRISRRLMELGQSLIEHPRQVYVSTETG